MANTTTNNPTIEELDKISYHSQYMLNEINKEVPNSRKSLDEMNITSSFTVSSLEKDGKSNDGRSL